MENELYGWIVDRRKSELAVSTQVLLWLTEIWEQFLAEIVENSFTASGSVFEDGVVGNEGQRCIRKHTNYANTLGT